MDTKQTQKTRDHHIEPFWRFVGSKLAKIDQNRPKFMDDPKIFRKFFLAQTILNGPIRKVIMVKVNFEDLRIFFTIPGQPGSSLGKFFKFFFRKKFFPQKVSKWSNSKSYHDKSEI